MYVTYPRAIFKGNFVSYTDQLVSMSEPNTFNHIFSRTESYIMYIHHVYHVYTHSCALPSLMDWKAFVCRKSTEQKADFSNYCLLKGLSCYSSNTLHSRRKQGWCWRVLSYPYTNLLSSFINCNIPFGKCFNIFLEHIVVKSPFVLSIKLITLLAT